MAGTDGVVLQVAQFSQSITGIGTVYAYHPIFADGSEFPAAWIWVDPVREERIALGGRDNGPGNPGNGRKRIYHTVNMRVHTSTSASEQDESDWRQLLDNVRATWRQNQDWNTTNGQVIRFGESIEVELDEPFRVGDMVQFRATFTSEAWEDVIG